MGAGCLPGYLDRYPCKNSGLGITGFLAVVNPRIAVICTGADNKFGHPSAEVVGRLEQELGWGNVYRTDVNGTIEFATDGERLWVEVER